MNSFLKEVEKGRGTLEEDIQSKLDKYVDIIGARIDGNFLDFDAMIKLEEAEMSVLNHKYQVISNQLQEIGDEMKQHLAAESQG